MKNKFLFFSFILLLSLIILSKSEEQNSTSNSTTSNSDDTNSDKIEKEKEAMREKNSKKFYENVDKIISEMGLSNSETLSKENLVYIFKRIFQKSEDEINKKNNANNTTNLNKTEKEIEHEQKKKEKVVQMIEKMTKYFSEDLPNEIKKEDLPKYLNIDTYAILVKKLLSGLGLGTLYEKAQKAAAEKAKGDL